MQISDYCLIKDNELLAVLFIPNNTGVFDIPEGIEAIGNNAFSGIKALIEVNIPDTVKIIKQKAFYNCQNLKTVKLPQSIEKVDEGAFAQCVNLENVEFYSSTGFSRYCFSGCAKLKELTVIRNGKKSIAQCFYFPVHNQFFISVPISHQIFGDIKIYKGKFMSEYFPVEINGKGDFFYLVTMIKNGKRLLWYDSSLRRAVDGLIIQANEKTPTEILGEEINENTKITPAQYSVICGICSEGVDWWLEKTGNSWDTVFTLGELIDLLEKTSIKGYNRLVVALSQSNKYIDLMNLKNGETW